MSLPGNLVRLISCTGLLTTQNTSVSRRAHSVEGNSTFLSNVWHTMISVQGGAAFVTGILFLRSYFQYKTPGLKQRSPSGSRYVTIPQFMKITHGTIFCGIKEKSKRSRILIFLCQRTELI